MNELLLFAGDGHVVDPAGGSSGKGEKMRNGLFLHMKFIEARLHLHHPIMMQESYR